MNYAILPLSIHCGLGGAPWDGWAAPNIWQWDRFHPVFQVIPDLEAEAAALGPVPSVEHWAPRHIRRQHHHLIAAAGDVRAQNLEYLRESGQLVSPDREPAHE
jgi:hypothetical protein